MNKKDIFQKLFINSLNQHRQLFFDLNHISVELSNAASICYETIKSGNTIFTCGNGGSACDAEHISSELVGRFMNDRRSLPSLSLTSSSSALTAISNDYSFENVFSRQLSGLAKEKDLLIAISTSGSSPNIISVLKKAKEMNVKTIALSSERGKHLVTHADLCILVPSLSTPRIQEAHSYIGHLLCEYVDELLKDKT